MPVFSNMAISTCEPLYYIIDHSIAIEHEFGRKAINQMDQHMRFSFLVSASSEDSSTRALALVYTK